MSMRNTLLTGIILLVLTFAISTSTAQPDKHASDNTNEIAPYEGYIGPDNALYGLKLVLENLDESLTFNTSRKLEKEIAHLNTRIAEAEAELEKNNSKAAEIALETFAAKSEDANNTISSLQGDSGLLNAFEMIKKHQTVLENLLVSHPGNRGLERALSNSKKLEQKFAKRHGLIAGEGGEEESVKINAEIINNDTEAQVSLKFRSVNVTNFTIAQEILDKFQLSTENINSLLTIENMDNGELKTELEAKAEIGDGSSNVEAGYKFPLLNITDRADIVSRIQQVLSALTIDNITSALKIEGQKEIQSVKGTIEGGKKEGKPEGQQNRKGGNEDKKANKQEDRQN